MILLQNDKDQALFSRKKTSESQAAVEYHCPVESCFYNINSPRFFKSFKILKTVRGPSSKN